MTEDLFSSTHPPLPPTTEDELFCRLRLLRSRRVGVSTFYRLMREHGSASRALDALPEVARAAGVKDYTPCPPEVAAVEMKKAKRLGATLLANGNPDYPATLAEIDAPPPLLWGLGDVSLSAKPMVSIVGARNASSLGIRMARKLSAELAEAGFVVVSGLARGIDAAAHAAALDTGTVAVLGCGVDVLYPDENRELFDNIGSRGLRLSEQAIGAGPHARHFPTRNRIIAGLSRGVIVIEAALKSGTLITAEAALSFGKEVLAVPGHPLDARAGGCNALLRDGASLVRSAEDVIEMIGPATPPSPPPKPTPIRSHTEHVELHQQIRSSLLIQIARSNHPVVG